MTWWDIIMKKPIIFFLCGCISICNNGSNDIGRNTQESYHSSYIMNHYISPKICYIKIVISDKSRPGSQVKKQILFFRFNFESKSQKSNMIGFLFVIYYRVAQIAQRGNTHEFGKVFSLMRRSTMYHLGHDHHHWYTFSSLLVVVFVIFIAAAVASSSLALLLFQGNGQAFFLERRTSLKLLAEK